VKPYGGIYFTHIRSEGEGIQDAIKEAIVVGEKAGVPVDIIHLKIADRRLWGRMKEICDLIESAQSRGLQISANQYPYTAGQNDLVALIPPWAMDGGHEKMLQRLTYPALRKRMEKEILKGIPGWFDHYLAIGDWDRCQIASVSSEKNTRYEGMSIGEISRISGKSPTDVVFELLRDENGSVPAIYFLMSEEDVRYAIERPWVSFGSDGSAVRLDGILGQGKPHPRWYGTFPRVLGKYVREEHVLTLEEAVRKMTGLNAEKLGFSDRGLLREGMKADVTVFDPHRIIDKATFQAPNQYAVGIEYVFVNGAMVIEKGDHLGTKPGRILRRNSQN
jgi:N-acyl-D-amino-acid deacylase